MDLEAMPGAVALQRYLEGDDRRLRCYSARHVRAVPDAGPRILEFILASEGVKRDGHSLSCSPEAWVPGCFIDLPGLWGHDMGSKGRPPLPPIGVWPEVRHVKDDVTGGWMLLGLFRFGTGDLAEQLYRSYLPVKDGGDGIARGCSLDWIPLEWDTIKTGLFMKRNEALEGSLVPVGADDRAKLRQRGFPEKLLEPFEEAARIGDCGRAYVLDWREPIESQERTQEAATMAEDTKTGEAEQQQSAETKAEQAAAPKVRHLGETAGVESFTVELPQGESAPKVAFVLQSRSGEKATDEQAQAMGVEIKRAHEARDRPNLPQGWRAIPVRSGQDLVLRHQDGEDRPERRRAVEKGLQETIAAGDVAVLGASWDLLPASRAIAGSHARSERSDALDVAFAHFEGLISEIGHHTCDLRWMVADAFYADEAVAEGEGTAAYLEKQGARKAKLIAALLNIAEEGMSEVLDLLTPEPVAVEPIVPFAIAQGAEQGIARIGKKIAKRNRARIKQARNLLQEALDEEDDDEEKDEKERSAAPSAGPLASVARDLIAKTKAMRGEQSAGPDDPPEQDDGEAQPDEGEQQPEQQEGEQAEEQQAVGRSSALSSITAKLRLGAASRTERKPSLGDLTATLKTKRLALGEKSATVPPAS